MRIAVDVEVLRDTMVETVRVYNQVYDDCVTVDQIETWELKGIMTKCSDPSSLFKLYPEQIFSVAHPHDGAIDFMKKLESDNHQVWVVTHQYRGVENHTVDWLQKYDIPYHSLCFTRDKSVVDCDILIDDGIHNLFPFQSKGKNAICMARPWNRSWNGYRVQNFDDAYEIINVFKN